MRVLMLGWHLPPRDAGGLGTACEGLLAGLRARDVDVTYVRPAPPVPPVLLGAAAAMGAAQDAGPSRPATVEVPSTLQPYPSGEGDPDEHVHGLEAFRRRRADHVPDDAGHSVEERARRLYRRFPPADRPRHVGLAPDRAEGARRYAEDVAERVGGARFDVIHAHDWMTWPAGQLLRERTGRPLVCHVHSTERDRAGVQGDPAVAELERAGLATADRVVCVSRASAEDVRGLYGVAEERLRVVHNAVRGAAPPAGARRSSPTVLFLGRVTGQKGPLAFLEIAARVAALLPEARFVLAGDGDLLPAARERARRLGLEARVEFPGFLADARRDAVLAAADLLVLPSVAEPFGIVALEAAAAGTPALVPDRAGATEVLPSLVRIDPEDAGGTAETIVRLLGDRRRLRRLTAALRRELAEAEWERRADDLLAIWGELVR